VTNAGYMAENVTHMASVTAGALQQCHELQQLRDD
jgi:hypothetical protein